ncbi:MAG: hypothetical protein AAB588_05820 [Patescibacteria group bacterium]
MNADPEILKDGQSGKFWEIIVEALNEALDGIEQELAGDRLRQLPAGQYKVENEILKTKRDNIKMLIRLPETLILHIESPVEPEIGFDPYRVPLDFENK